LIRRILAKFNWDADEGVLIFIEGGSPWTMVVVVAEVPMTGVAANMRFCGPVCRKYPETIKPSPGLVVP